MSDHDSTIPHQSPIRPQASGEDSATQSQRLVPTKPGTGALSGGEPIRQESLEDPAHAIPDQALAQIRQRLSQVAEEFAEGKINRAQFHAIYNRYHEQRNIIEKLIARNPQSTAWQQVAQSGHTSFLREHFVAKIRFYALFAIGSIVPIVRHGDKYPPANELLPILRQLPSLIKAQGGLGPARKHLTNKQWLAVIPGQYTVSIAVYSLEPAKQQIQRLTDLHHDFERANIHTLGSGDLAHNRLVYPQRALFEDGRAAK